MTGMRHVNRFIGNSPIKGGVPRIEPLEAEGGVVSKRSLSLLVDVREAHPVSINQSYLGQHSLLVGYGLTQCVLPRKTR
jgi:hypothetical protein